MPNCNRGTLIFMCPSGPELHEPCGDYAMCIYIYGWDLRIKTPGMLACTGLRQINYGSGCGRKDMGTSTVSEVVWAPIDRYTTGLIGAGPIACTHEP